ncbi:MAG: HEAT repeat domain-containing protein, partial [Methanogenium sp.]|nr:HEAT repeat domain-containing protein [Methanogenium sp.]
PLMNALREEDSYIKVVAARSLGRIGNKTALDALAQSLKVEKDADVRAVAAESLGYIGSAECITVLADALRDRDEGVQLIAARSLGYIGDQNSIEALIVALNDVDYTVRKAALNALKDPEGAPQDHLISSLKNGDRKFRTGVAEALDILGWEPADDIEKSYYLIARERLVELESVGSVAIGPLMEIMNDPSPERRIDVVKTIAHIGGEMAVSPLISALNDESLFVKRRAEGYLIEMGERVSEPLSAEIGTGSSEYDEILRRIIARIQERVSESVESVSHDGDEGDDQSDDGSSQEYTEDEMSNDTTDTYDINDTKDIPDRESVIPGLSSDVNDRDDHNAGSSVNERDDVNDRDDENTGSSVDDGFQSQ